MITDSFAATLDTAATPTPATRAISSDFETFLRMLTVQLENQDPLNPVESSDYAVQLATFSGVEQQVLTNDLLRSLSGQMGLSGLGQMAGWVGREARTDGPVWFDGAPLTLYPLPADGATRAEIVVIGAEGQELQRLALPPGGGPLEWAGAMADGGALPDGAYRFRVVSYQGDAVLSETPVATYAEVTEVRLEAGAPVVVLRGGIVQPAGAVTALRG